MELIFLKIRQRLNKSVKDVIIGKQNKPNKPTLVFMNKNILYRFSKHTKQAVARAQEIALNDGEKEVYVRHLLQAIAQERGSVGQIILTDLLFKKRNFLAAENTWQKIASIPFSQELKEIFKKAAKIAAEHFYPYIGTEHLVYAALETGDAGIASLFGRLEQKTQSKEEDQEDAAAAKERKEKLAFDPTGVLKEIDPEEAIGSSLMNNSSPNPLLENNKAAFMAQDDLNGEEGGINFNGNNIGRIPDFLQAMNIQITPRISGVNNNPLRRFAKNLNQENEKEGTTPVIGREKEVDRMINVLLRKSKNNPVLIGEPGVGKTAIVSALAQRINKGEVPRSLSDKIIYELDLGLLLSGTTFRGEFEQRMKEVINYASKNEQVILFIDEIHNLIGAGSAQGSLDAANMLKPSLARGDLKLIGATTLDEYRRHIEKDSALERRFQPILVDEPTREQTKKILTGIKKHYEKFHGVLIDPKAIDAAIDLSVRYIHDRSLPDKAIDLIDEAQAKVRSRSVSFEMIKKMKHCFYQKKKLEDLKKKLILNNEFDLASGLRGDEKELEEIIGLVKTEQSRREKLAYLKVLDRDIKEVVAVHTGIPLEDLSVGEKGEVKNLEKKLEKQVVGQKPAITSIVKTVKRSWAGLSDAGRPLGSFVFLGPSGVGKTYLAKVLAETIFKKASAFIRIDMSEFHERHHLSQLIGAPAGYVGYEDGGKLTEKVRRNPYSLILFDEIEKGHPEVINILLQILEEGILTDAAGRTVDFKNTLIIITSNAGTEKFNALSIGFEEADEEAKEKRWSSSEKTKKAAEEAKKKLREVLAPEMLNRLDQILVFNPLSLGDLKKIAQREAEKIKEKLKEKEIDLSIDKRVYELIAEKSAKPEEGARLIRKNITKYISDPLAEKLVEGEKLRNKKVKVGAKKGRVVVAVS